jgi:tryptophanyl-tRNA synthetase
MQRMTQFKDKSQKNEDNINMGLLDYPVLMAADILLYQASFVPVGADQKQHVEITRDIANRFNNLFGETFTLPEPLIGRQDQGARICSLQNPLAKMSKSDENPDASVWVTDDPAAIMRKFKRAVTDSESAVAYRPDKPGISNLLTIMSRMTGRTIADLEKEYAEGGYQKFKNDAGESVVEKFRPIRETYLKLMGDKAYLAQTAKKGAERAAFLAEKTLRKVKKKVGLTEK